jgi:mannose-6-phosphate isomerase-like protein (cupin superfamily)
MTSAHVFDAAGTDWATSERFRDIRMKVFETRQTHPWASVILVELKVDGLIDTHVHPTETETVYVLAGQGLLTHGDNHSTLAPGMGASVPPGLPHSLRNIGSAPLELIAFHMPPVR